jgi:hypothetical protein
MNKSMESSLPCVCGHYKNIHIMHEDTRCIQAIQMQCHGTYYVYCPCMKFKLNNLKYLEQCYESNRQ